MDREAAQPAGPGLGPQSRSCAIRTYFVRGLAPFAGSPQPANRRDLRLPSHGTLGPRRQGCQTKRPRFDFADARLASWARVPRIEQPLLPRTIRSCPLLLINDRNNTLAMRFASRTDSPSRTFDSVSNHESIDDRFDIVQFLRHSFGISSIGVRRAINPCRDEPRFLNRIRLASQCAPFSASAPIGANNIDLRVSRQAANGLLDFRDRLLGDRRAAGWAQHRAHAGHQQSQVIVDLCDRSDRAPRGFARPAD